MRILKLLFATLTCVFLSSCLEISDETEIKEDGSGQFSSTMDLGQLIDMMQAMGGEEFDKKKDEVLDSVIYLKDIVDTAKNLDAKQKKLMRNGKMHIKMNMKEKLFTMNMQYPFNNLQELQELNNAVSSGGIGFGNFMKDAMGGTDESSADSDSPDMSKILSIFDHTFENGLIKKTVNAGKLKELKDDPKMTEIQQGADMGIELLYKVIYKLPRPVKNVDNPKAKISEDKKTVSVTLNLMEVFSKPEQFAFTIEY